MKVKRVVKTICFIAACLAVGVYLYSRMHADYLVESKPNKSNISREKEDDVLEKVAFPEHFQKEVSELLIFDTKVVVNEGVALQDFKMATAVRVPIDEEKTYSYFIGDRDGVSTTVHDNYFDLDGYKTPLTRYEYKEKYLSTSMYDITYDQSPQMNYVNNSFCTSPLVNNYNKYLYSKEENLEFMDRKTAWDKVLKNMEELGLDMSTASAQVIYSLDMETMKQEEQCIDVNGNEIEEEKNPEWSKSDEGYYYFVTQSYQGIPFYATNKLESEEEEECNTPLTIFQTEEGLISVILNRWFTIAEKEELLEFAPFEKIMFAVEDKYSGTIYTNPLTVQKAKLCIFTIQNEDGTYTLSPAWICTIAENHVDWGSEAYTSYIYMAINAITGEEMPELGNN